VQEDDKSTKAGAARNRFQISDLDFEIPAIPSGGAGAAGHDEKETKVALRDSSKPSGTQVFVVQSEELDSVGLIYCRTGLRKGQIQQLTKRRNEFGRALDCDIVVEDDHVSAHHGAFLLDGGVWKAFDFASANGTFVNGKRLGSEGPNPADLADDDTIKLGNREFVFKQIKV
jgi:pSer/pThr/pTyr-binding forkhead associated (FHA) protein